MTKTFILKDHTDVTDIMAACHALLVFDKVHAVKIHPYTKKRTDLQNDCSHKWYRDVEKKEEEYSASMIKCLCKFHFGLNILRGDDADYNSKCVKFIDPLPYEYKIEAMEFFPVTSFFNTKQFGDYLKAIRHNYAGRVDLRFRGEEELF
jgi:hypothetical protein